MREIRTSGLMSGDGKRGDASVSVLAPILDSTHRSRSFGIALYSEDRQRVEDLMDGRERPG
jgi:hypothetical protein